MFARHPVPGCVNKERVYVVDTTDKVLGSSPCPAGVGGAEQQLSGTRNLTHSEHSRIYFWPHISTDLDGSD